MDSYSSNFNLNATLTNNRKSQASRNVVFPRASMEEAKKAIRGFVRGADGQLKIAPWPGAVAQATTSTSTNGPSNSSEKRKTTRKYIPLEPLNIQAMVAALGPIPPETKPTLVSSKSKPVSTRIPSHDKQVRKELFKVPQRKRLSFGTKAKPSPRKPSVPVTRRSINLADSPLLDFDEASAILTEKRVMETPRIVVSQHETPPIVARLDPEIAASGKEKTCGTALGPIKEETPPTVEIYNPNITSTDSDKEFAESEKNCASPMPTSLGSSKNSKISAIKVLLEKNQADFNSLKRIMGNLEENQKKLIEMLSQLAFGDEDKENFDPKPSSAISKNKQDLRRFAVNKNFAAIGNQSPRTKKAVELYNTVRNDCGILCTPKLNRDAIIDTPQCSAKKSLSRKIQKQCLLLQDTPRP